MKFLGTFERQATFIFIASTLSNIGAYLFHVYMGRHLPETECGMDFGGEWDIAFCFQSSLALDAEKNTTESTENYRGH